MFRTMYQQTAEECVNWSLSYGQTLQVLSAVGKLFLWLLYKMCNNNSSKDVQLKAFFSSSFFGLKQWPLPCWTRIDMLIHLGTLPV